MKKKLKIASRLSLPVEAITETFAFLARRGAGKTYNAGVLAEEMLELGAQIVVLDPVGKWWGLRVGADGRSPGYSLPMFGGKHGDIPLTPTSGDLIAQLIVEKDISAILDLTGFRSDEEQRRFVTAFARKLFRLKQAQEPPTPLHLFLEEAEEFLPQDQLRDQAQMIGAVKKLIKLGRNYGVGCSLVSQRSADINKKGLSQIGTMVALQTTSPHDRKAVRDWAHGVGKDDSLETRIQTILPSLRIGEAFMWSPTFDIAQKVRFRKKRTFDTSATPKLGRRKRVEPKRLSQHELSKIEADMVDTIEEAKKNDPVELRKRIRGLEKQLASKPGKPSKVIERVEVEVEVPIPVPIEAPVRKLEGKIAAAVEAFQKEVGKLEQRARGRRNRRKPIATSSTISTQPAPRARPPASPRAAPSGNGEIKLKKGARRMLAAVATSSSGRLTRDQIGTLAQLSTRSGTFSDYLSSLRRGGFVIDVADGSVEITEYGRNYLGPEQPDVPTTTDELLALWGPKLKAGARRMLHCLVRAYPDQLTRAQLCAEAEISQRSGTFSDYLSSLRRNGLLIDEGGGDVRASDTLFPG